MIKDEIVQLVQRETTAYSLWEKLKQLYELSRFSARHNSFQNLIGTHLNQLGSVETYIDKMKQYEIELLSMGAAVPKWLVISTLLNKLGSSFEIWSQQVIQSIRT